MEVTNPGLTAEEMVVRLEKELAEWKAKANLPDYATWEVDKLVYVRDSNMVPWVPRHFACLNQKGNPCVWLKGRTSLTTDNYGTWAYITDDIGDDEFSKS